jgi:hypothetical protein
MERTTMQRIAFGAICCTLVAAPACAQRPNASQHGTVSQEIASTKISIEYDRPVARGRQLFGVLVPWGRVWTPGANWATTIELSDDVQVEGQQLAKGRYSIWTIPEEQEWTVIFSKTDRAFHMRYPEGQDALRVHVHPIAGAHMETLALYFPVVGPDSAVLNIHWGTTVVPLHIRIQ